MTGKSVFTARIDLSALSHEELLSETQKLAENERRISVEVLQHLWEIDRRRAFVKRGHASLWEYALKELKYSEGAAYRRISAMRALNSYPELEEKLQTGTLSVSTVSQVQTFLKAEQLQANKTYSKDQKAAIFKKCENMSSREVTRELINLSPLALKVQKERTITENRTEISFIVDSDLLGKIHRVRDLSVSRLRNPTSYPELVNFMSEVTLDEIDPLRKPVREVKSEKKVALITTSRPTHSVKQSRTISPALRTQIWQEFGGKCGFIDPKSEKRCNATFGLEIEHCKPYSMGGSSKDPDNLKLLCKQHNQWQAIQTYGLTKMEPYLNSKKDVKLSGGEMEKLRDPL